MGIVVKACILTIRYTILNWLFWVVTAAVGFLKLYLLWARSFLICPGRINGKTVIVTGANTGLGFEISRILASRGARIIMACRNMGSAFHAKAAISQLTGNSNIEIQQLDLSSLWSVRQFAKGIIERESRVDVLIHCAGVMGIKNSKSNDDLQILWQINYLSPFLLTHLLLDMLKKSSPSRVIMMGSTLHHFSKLHLYLDQINEEGTYSHFRSYCDTALANILASKYFAQKLKGTGVTVNAANPGLVNVRLRRINNEVLQTIVGKFMEFFGKTMEEGASTTVMCAVKPELEDVTGQYFSECKFSECLSKQSKDMKLAERLWRKSEELVSLENYEKLL